MEHKSNNQRRNQRKQNKKGDKQDEGTSMSNFSLQSGVVPLSSRTKYNDKVYTFIRHAKYPAFQNTSNTIFVSTGLTLQLSQIQGYAEFTSLFDQYRIAHVDALVIPKSSSVGTSLASLMYSVIDYDDSAALTATSILEYSNMMVTTLESGHRIRFKPHAAVALDGSGVFTSYGNVAAPWIDCASTGVDHFGLKIGTEVTSSSFPIDVYLTVKLQFRNVR
jgi:hypothetical protein